MEEQRLPFPKRTVSTVSVSSLQHTSTGPTPRVPNNEKEKNIMNLIAALRAVSSGLAAATLCLGFGMSLSAQVQTKTNQTAGQAKSQVTVERATVVSVEENDLIVKMDDGTIRHFPNVPESARATVDGQQLGIHDLKPGMHLSVQSLQPQHH